MTEHNNLLLDIIIHALKGYMQEIGNSKNGSTEDEQDNGKFSYLLGQAIRHWIIPAENWHTSEAAMTVWKKISDKKITQRRYKESFTCKPSAMDMVVPRFSGSAKDFEKLDLLRIQIEEKTPKGKRKLKQYAFSDIFIAEHTTPVADIIDALAECYTKFHETTEYKDKIKEVLNKIHITQMLRIEDRRIVMCKTRINKVLEKKNQFKSIYDYLICTEDKEVFKDIHHTCYSKLPPKVLKDSYAIKQYNDRVLSFKRKYNKGVPNWARAIEIQRKYTINIHSNNQKQ